MWQCCSFALNIFIVKYKGGLHLIRGMNDLTNLVGAFQRVSCEYVEFVFVSSLCLFGCDCVVVAEQTQRSIV
jgi:hypothetical protein